MTEPALRSLRDQWTEEGYCLYRSLLSEDEVTDLLRITERVRRQWLVASAEDGQPGDADRHNMRHLNHPGYFRDHPGEFATLMNLIADERILAFARELLDGEPVFRATTRWFEPRTAHEDGSWHHDVQFLKPDEQEQRTVVATRTKPDGIQLQIALVETSDVEYVPGSRLRCHACVLPGFPRHLRRRPARRKLSRPGVPTLTLGVLAWRGRLASMSDGAVFLPTVTEVVIGVGVAELSHERHAPRVHAGSRRMTGRHVAAAVAVSVLLLALAACATEPPPCPPHCAGADLRGANLRGSDLRGADLNGADLTAADLRGAILTGANLRHATLRRAALAGALLIAVDLTGSDLTEADLTGAVLTRADLTDSVLIDVRGCDANGRLPGCTAAGS